MNNLTLKDIKTKLSSENLDKKELEKLADDISRQILIAIEKSNQSIKDAEESLKYASYIDTSGSDLKNILSFGVFGDSKTDKIQKRQNLESKFHYRTLEAIKDINNLIQESIKFTRINAQFSMLMNYAIANLVAKGFKDSNNNHKQICKETEEFAQIIMEEAQNWAEEKLKEEERHNKIIQAIVLQDEADKIHTQGIAKNKEMIDSNTRLIKYLEDTMKSQDDMDKFHTKEINKNAQYLEAQQKQIDEILANINKKSLNLGIVLGVLAVILSTATLILNFVKI